MKLVNLVGDRFKERPADCVVDSHALMVRGGYMKYVANGIYSSYLPLKRITRKIEAIIRDEMDRIDGQEVQFPVVLPASLWEESGRYESVGKELLRFTDRNHTKMVLGMTHEEAAVSLVRDYANTYNRYPFMIYQFQTKFRDEARPRAGLIRVREFTMKDGYSFHTSQEDLEEYYQRCHQAYERIYARTGIPEVISVASDSGMMGGNISHEFMLLTPIGEDSIAICTECDYRANMEAAEVVLKKEEEKPSESLENVATPNMHTIEEICEFFRTEPCNTCKAVVYQTNSDDQYVVIFLRGDLEVNETKIVNLIGDKIHPAVITEECGLQAGFIGPYQLNGSYTVLYDRSLEQRNNLICGANEKEYHYKGLDMNRDVPGVVYHDLAKIKDGGICPKCGNESIHISRGIEVGNIFQLGDKYTKTMHMTFVDQEGNTKIPVMGCYGIGVGRLAAAVCEAHHDEFGPIWPMEIAPWQVHLCAVRSDDEQIKNYADQLYNGLMNQGVEVIYDDRKAAPGVMFADADLLGVPVRAIMSPRNMKKGIVELVTRDKTVREEVSMEEAADAIMKLVKSF